MPLLDHLTVADIHVNTARQARVKTADRPHHVDSLEVLRPVLFKDRLPLDGVLVRPWRSVVIARTGVPRGWRIGMIVCDLPVANDHMMREYAANRLSEAATDGFLRDVKLVPGLGPSGAHFRETFLQKVERARRGISLEIGARAIALERVRPLRNLPLQTHRTFRGRPRQVDFNAPPGGFDITHIDHPAERRR